MRDKKTVPVKCTISQIIKLSEDDGGGLLGFTISYTEADFENVVQRFLPDNYNKTLAELHKKRNKLIRKLNIEG